MVAEHEVVQNVNAVHGVVLVLLFQVFEDLDFLFGLSVEALFITNKLQSSVRLRLVVVRLYNLPERTLSEDFQHLISIRDMIVRHANIRPVLFIVATVVRAA